MFLRGGEEEVALRAVSAGLTQTFVEFGVEANGVHRHLDVGCGGKLSAHSAHALAGGTFALMGFALNNKYVLASGLGQMPGNAGADDASADDGSFCGFHSRGHCNWQDAKEDVMIGC